jgi:hypothetical protein
MEKSKVHALPSRQTRPWKEEGTDFLHSCFLQTITVLTAVSAIRFYEGALPLDQIVEANQQIQGPCPS